MCIRDRAKALATGAIGCAVIDMRETFANEYLSCAMAANAMYENKYPLVSALSRPLIAKHLVAVAHQFGAKYAVSYTHLECGVAAVAVKPVVLKELPPTVVQASAARGLSLIHISRGRRAGSGHSPEGHRGDRHHDRAH